MMELIKMLPLMKNTRFHWQGWVSFGLNDVMSNHTLNA